MFKTERHQDVLVIALDNPPVNALSITLCRELRLAIDAAASDPAVKAVLILGAGKLFSGGADFRELERTGERALAQLLDSIEACPKPVVAAMHGSALGGGLELALACHYRVATPSARLGLPQVRLGLLPDAGGTQRLPRLIGAEAALRLIASGDSISGKEAESLGLIDRLAGEETLLEDTMAFARGVGVVRRTANLSLHADPRLFERFIAENARRHQGLDAPVACIEAVRAATELGFRKGLEKEHALFQSLLDRPQSRALRHIFFAECAAARVADLPKDTPLRPLARVGVIGAGTMGGGIAMSILCAGIPVRIAEATQEMLDRGIGAIRRSFEASATKGRLTAEEVDKAMSLLSATLELDALSDCDLLIEAVYEDMGVKKDVFTRISRIAKPGAILASNTSFLSIDHIAAVTDRPQDMLGLHFFSPAHIMRLLEVVRGARTAPDVLATGMDLARRIGKVPVVARVCHGFIGNRMLLQRQRQAESLLLEGATPEQIDRVHTAFGMPMGPFQMIDLAGVDIGWHRDPSRIETVYDALCADGRWGQKTRRGFYDYDDRRHPSPSPVTAAIIEKFRARTSTIPRRISDEEILARTVYTMINEGAKILEEGVTQRVSDIDVVWVFGYGWPRHTGGPMFWGETLGLETIVRTLRRYRAQLDPDFTFSPLLLKCADRGRPLEGEL